MKNQIFETKFKINITESNINIVNYNNKIALFDTADTATLYMHFLEE